MSIKHIVNITMKVGDDALKAIERFHQAEARRLSTMRKIRRIARNNELGIPRVAR